MQEAWKQSAVPDGWAEFASTPLSAIPLEDKKTVAKPPPYTEALKFASEAQIKITDVISKTRCWCKKLAEIQAPVVAKTWLETVKKSMELVRIFLWVRQCKHI